jgi:adenylate cyclase
MNPVEQIKQRKIVQWSLAYLAGAWVVLQVLDFLSGQFGWPAALVRGATVFLAISFLAVLVLAWYHGERGVQRAAPLELVLLLVIVGSALTAAVLLSKTMPDRPSATNVPAAEASIAVLPFLNMSGNKDNEYFADGVTEEILNALAKIQGMRVASRTSSFQFKGRDTSTDIADVASKLHVGHVLEGSVRAANDRVRVTAQLVKASDGFHVWSEIYDRDLKDIFAVQEEIARAIAGVLRVRLLGADSARLAHRGTEDVEAYTLFLRGKELANGYNEPDLRAAIDIYNRAVERDSTFARAHAAISDAWTQLADDWLPPLETYPKARAAALRAISVDSLEPDGYAMLGFVQIAFDWKLNEALANMEQVLRLAPNNPDALLHRGLVLLFTNRMAEAERDLDAAVRVDPLAALTNTFRIRLYLQRHEWDRVIAAANSVLETNPGYLMCFRLLGDAYLGKQQPQQALEAYRKGLSYDRDFARLRSGEVRALAALGRMDEAKAKAQRLADEGSDRYVRAEEVAQAWIAVNEVEHAFDWLQRAERERSAGLMFLNAWPAYDPLRNDPRFTALVERVGLPAVTAAPR